MDENFDISTESQFAVAQLANTNYWIDREVRALLDASIRQNLLF